MERNCSRRALSAARSVAPILSYPACRKVARIDRLTEMPDLEMQVRAGRESARSDQADQLATLYPGARSSEDATEMRVARHHSVRMGKADLLPIATAPPCAADHAVRRGEHRRAPGCTDVDPVMKAAEVKDWVDAVAKA